MYYTPSVGRVGASADHRGTGGASGEQQAWPRYAQIIGCLVRGNLLALVRGLDSCQVPARVTSEKQIQSLSGGFEGSNSAETFIHLLLFFSLVVRACVCVCGPLRF